MTMEILRDYVVNAVLVALLFGFSVAVLRAIWSRMRRQGLVFVLIAAGFLASMATKPDQDTDPDTDPDQQEEQQETDQDDPTPTPTPDPDPDPETDPDPDPETDPDPDPETDPDPDPTPAVVWRLAPDSDTLPDLSVANIYDGYAYDANNSVVASVQVKTAKAGKGSTTAKVTATVTWLSTGKKVNYKNGLVDSSTGIVSDMTAGNVTLSAQIGAIGLTGTLGSYSIDGARNVFSAKDSYAKSVAASAMATWKKNYNMAWTDSTGMNVLSVSVAAKGKVKVSGTLATGVKVSSSAQMSVGKDGDPCGIPVLITKKAKMSFMIWLTSSGNSVTGIDDAIIAPVAGLTKTCAVSCQDASSALASAIIKTQSNVDRVLTDYLPNGVSVSQSGTKWSVDGGKKAGKIAIVKTTGEVDTAKSKIDGFNVSGLKLTYTAKTGAFKGSFKVYYVVGSGSSFSLKNLSITVTGVVIDGIGYGSMTNKKLGTFSFTIQ